MMSNAEKPKKKKGKEGVPDRYPERDGLPVSFDVVKKSERSLDSAWNVDPALFSMPADLEGLLTILPKMPEAAIAASITGKVERVLGKHANTKKDEGRITFDGRVVNLDVDYVHEQMRRLGYEPSGSLAFLHYLEKLGDKASKDRRYVCTAPIPGYHPWGSEYKMPDEPMQTALARSQKTDWYLTAVRKRSAWKIEPVQREMFAMFTRLDERVVLVGVQKAPTLDRTDKK